MSSKFHMKRHSRKPPPWCAASRVSARMAQSPMHPFTLTGVARWLDQNATPPINAEILMDLQETQTPEGWAGSSTVLGVTLSARIERQPATDLYDVYLTVATNGWTDDDSWHFLPWPPDRCDFDTGLIQHVYTPGVDENSVQFSV